MRKSVNKSDMKGLWKFIANLFAKKDKPSESSSEQPNNKRVTNEDKSGIKKNKIQAVLNVFETGSVKGNYSKISIFRDGKGNSRQITYGKSQTTEQGNLKHLLEIYIDNGGKYSSFFKPYLAKLKKVPLVDDRSFIEALKKAGSEKVMQKSQDEFFDKVYWNRAIAWCKQNGIETNLGILVVYDSYIHSGSIPSFLRRRFAATPPAKGGSEKAWITQYVNTRESWLANHSRKILRKTTYRTKFFKKEIEKNNWNLDGDLRANGVLVPENLG